MTFLAVFILVTGVFYGARKVYHFGVYQYQFYKNHRQDMQMTQDKMCDTTMMKCCKGGMKDTMKCCKDKAAKCCKKDK
jgi:hypothetical protein